MEQKTRQKQVREVEKTPKVQADLARAVVVKKTGKNKCSVIGLVLLVFLAVGGTSFGVWAMVDRNAQKDLSNSQISILKKEVDDLSDQIAALEEANPEYQASILENQGIVETEGYRVLSIDACIADSGTAASPVTIIKCDAVTSDGDGKFIYDSESNELRFVKAE